MALFESRKSYVPSFLPSRTTMFLTGLAIGILYAPRTGRATRSLIAQKYERSITQVSRWFEDLAKMARYQSNRLQGTAYEMKEAMTQNGEVGDDVLPQRIKSELGRFFNVTDLEITAREGVVTLRGTLGNDQEKQNMVEMAKKIRGVRDVVSMLY